MAEHLSGRELLPDSSSLVLRSVERDDHRWVVETSGSGVAACPDCGAVSSARHSKYWRHLKDLPLQGSAVLLRVQVGRWHCHNPVCERQIFCERLRHVTHKYAQETNRFGETVQMIGYALGGRPGERLSGRLAFSVSDDTLLRRVKQAAQFHRPARAIPVVGVDEWAWRKGYSGYGTILVDLKQRVVADLLPDRSAASFEQWLKQHPGVRTISRDRDGVYAEGGYGGAPRAKQVADRFHLVQNLIKAVQEELAHQRHHLLMPAQELVRNDSAEQVTGAEPERAPSPQRGPLPSPRQKEIRQQRRQQKAELFRIVKGLHAQGMRGLRNRKGDRDQPRASR